MSLGRLWPYQRCSSVQWYERETQAGWSYLAWSNPSPHLAALYEPFFGPTFGKHLLTLNRHFPFWQMSHTRRAAGWTSIWPLRYWTTALPVMLSTVSLSGHVERCSIFFLLQWNLSLGERQASDLSSSMAVFVRTIWSLVIPRYEVLTDSWEGGVEPITMLETRSHPPEMKSCFLLRKNNRLKAADIL